MKIGFIGAGNMAGAIIGGLVKQGFNPQDIFASNRNQEKLNNLKDSFGIQICENNQDLIAQADAIVLSVKPQGMKVLCEDIKASVQKHNNLVISIAAGLEISCIEQWLGGNIAMIRCMPNTPSLVQTGASGLFANIQTNQTQKDFAQQLFDAVGISVWVDSEYDIHAVTAISGSAPAYYFLFMQAMMQAGVKQGLTEQAARDLTVQSALGAAKMMKASDESAESLRKKVTSPGGTTQQAILSFEKNQLLDIVEQAMQACADKSVELSKVLAK
ncbi:MAG: pyrroline-5-carboxylate reductase [Saccharospirillaceae bacterium]|nr:pyrroline-5-carboxylate reductase [Pseudomonadales bacterium]NRB78953.1 pyrroline-5-carboxylate reductase [Saccharospirillaceae bacterium]